MRGRIQLIIGVLLLTGAPRFVVAQVYHSLSLRAQQMGYGSQAFSYFTLTPGYTIGNRHFRIMTALEIPAQQIAAKKIWAGQELRPSEQVTARRWLGKIRLKSQSESGRLGFIYGAANFYSLDISYQNTAVFGDTASQSKLNLATYGAGLFEFWEIGGQIVHLLGVETMVLTDFETMEWELELKALIGHAIKLGLMIEAIQPKPQFTNLYAGVYIEYALTW